MSDPSPFGMAYTRYSAQLHSYVLRRLRNPDATRDVIQEVFARLLRANEAALVKSTQAFLYGIANNVLHEMRRKAQRDPLRLGGGDDPAEDFEVQTRHLQQEDSSERLNLRLQLERALAQLPPMHAAVLLCIKRDGMSYAETAERVGLPLKAVKRLLCDAKARMMMLRWDR